MAYRYHINGKGEPGKCSATSTEEGGKGCPFGGEHQHYDSPEKARQAFELSMAGATLKPQKKNTPGNVTYERISEPGEHVYEQVTSSNGVNLGTITYREGFYMAAVHDGRRPYGLGQFISAEDATRALIKNNGANQKQPSLEAKCTNQAGMPPTEDYQKIIDKMDDFSLEREMLIIEEKVEEGSLSKEERDLYLKQVTDAHDKWHTDRYGFVKKDLTFDRRSLYKDMAKRAGAHTPGGLSDPQARSIERRLNELEADFNAKVRTTPAKSHEANVPIRLIPTGATVYAPHSAGSDPYKKVGVPHIVTSYNPATGKDDKTDEVVGKYFDGVQWDYVDPATTFTVGNVPEGKGLSPRWAKEHERALKLQEARKAYAQDNPKKNS